MNSHLIVATYQELGIFKGLPLSISISGIGRDNAYKNAKIAITKGASCLISSGTATALSPHIKIGDIIIPNIIISSNKEKLYIPYCNKVIENLKKIKSPRIFCGPLLETDKVLVNSQDKIILYQNTGCIAADMESAGILKAANEANLPFVCIRAVSDSLNMNIPQWLLISLKKDGNISFSLLIKGFLCNLNEFHQLIKLAVGFFKAKKSLRYIMSRICSSFPL